LVEDIESSRRESNETNLRLTSQIEKLNDELVGAQKKLKESFDQIESLKLESKALKGTLF
jgi:hypothetical protein